MIDIQSAIKETIRNPEMREFITKLKYELAVNTSEEINFKDDLYIHDDEGNIVSNADASYSSSSDSITVSLKNIDNTIQSIYSYPLKKIEFVPVLVKYILAHELRHAYQYKTNINSEKETDANKYAKDRLKIEDENIFKNFSEFECIINEKCAKG